MVARTKSPSYRRPKYVTVTLSLLFSKEISKKNIHQISIFKTENILNGSNSLIDHSFNTLKERGLIIKK